MKKILWFSRHEMTPDQKGALEKKLGDINVTQISKTISSAYELQEEILAADIVAIVAPINLQQQFLKIAGDRPVITAVSERKLVPSSDGGEDQVQFVFRGWKQLKKIEVIMDDFA